MGTYEMAKVPSDYPKWESMKWPKSPEIARNGNPNNGHGAERLPEKGVQKKAKVPKDSPNIIGILIWEYRKSTWAKVYPKWEL